MNSGFLRENRGNNASCHLRHHMPVSMTHLCNLHQNTAILEIAPAYAELHSEVIGDSFVMKDGYVLPPQKPGLGIELTDQTKHNYPFARGSGEFNDAPGKILRD